MVVDRDLRFIKLNKKADSVIRAYYPEELIGKKITEVNLSIKDNEPYDDLLKAFDGEIIIRDKVKSAISNNYYEHNYVPLSDATGVYAVMIISHDITESIRQTEELRKAIEADKLKSDFIKMASHELKTPIHEFSLLFALALIRMITRLQPVPLNHPTRACSVAFT